MIKVWGRLSSSNVQALMWCIGELDLAYSRSDAGFIYGVVDTDEYREINPNGTVPTIIDADNAPLWETGAIMRYLASAYGSEEFWPKDPSKRCLVDQWAEWSKIQIALNFTSPVFWHAVRVRPEQRAPELLKKNLDTLSRYLSIADQRLSKYAYLAGDDFTLADIQFAHCLYRYFDIDIPRKKLIHLDRYYAMISQRSAYQQYVQVDYSVLVNSL